MMAIKASIRLKAKPKKGFKARNRIVAMVGDFALGFFLLLKFQKLS